MFIWTTRDEHQYTEWSGGVAFSQMPSCLSRRLEQTWRWIGRRELCVEIRSHPYICLTQASLSFSLVYSWAAGNRSMDVVCQSSLATPFCWALFLHLFFFYWRRQGICSDFPKRKGQLGKELQTHKRGGRRPCIPHGLSIDFIPLHSLVLFFFFFFSFVPPSLSLFVSSFSFGRDVYDGYREARG